MKNLTGIPVTRLLVLMLLLFTGALVHAGDTKRPTALAVTGDVRGVHDPSIIKQGDTYYLFTTGIAPHGHIAIRCSNDLRVWRHCGQVFEQLPTWLATESPKTKELWAPDISYFNGKYHLYYSFSSFGSNVSGIALATNSTLNPADGNYKWVDEGIVFRSHKDDPFNAIDPNLVIDNQGRGWIVFGSFWSGLKMFRIDPKTGKRTAEDMKLYSVAGRARPANPEPAKPGLPPDWQAIEAPFIVHKNGYYYLFASYDLCCRGVNSNYNIRVGRAVSVTGPYVDNAGKPMTENGAVLLLSSNTKWVGPGHEAVLLQEEGEGDVLVFHAYDAKTGKSSLQISTIAWKDGWPQVTMDGTEVSRALAEAK